MTHSNTSLHVYAREISSDERTSLSVLVSLVGSGAKVLDLGTGSGALGAYLKKNKNCTLDGVTFNQAEADTAGAHYHRLEVADLDACELDVMFAGERYDAIVCADVLEHLKYPERVLAACSKLLAPQGQVLISVPNASYCGLVGELLSGELRYREEGLLDRTHLRFFTRTSLARFLGEEGWQVDAIDTIQRDLPGSEFSLEFDRLPPAVARYLVGVPDALTYQFIVAAKPVAAGTKPVPPTATGPLGGQALFTAQLFVGDDSGYREEHKITATGVIGAAQQTLRFVLPADRAHLTRMRLDPADRPGFLHLHAMALRATDNGPALWQWQADASGLDALVAAPQHQMVVRPPWGGSGPVMLLLHGDDPWFELPLAGSQCAVPGFGASTVLEVVLGWPMSADYLALADAIDPLRRQLRSVTDDAFAERDHAHRAAAAEHARRERELVEARANWEREVGEARAQWERDATAAHARHHQDLLDARATWERESTAERVRWETQATGDRRHQQNLTEAAELALQASRAQRDTLELAHHSSEVARQALESNCTALQAHIAELASHIGSDATAIAQLCRQRDELAAHIQWIENSTVFRLSRPLVRLKMRADRLLGRGPDAAAPHTAVQAAPTAVPRAQATDALPVPPRSVDVIVPVYRGLFDTRNCIESVLTSVCRTPWRLLVINDASPEPEVTAYLRQVAATDVRIVLLENEENLGFVGTVNRGMSYSKTEDVLLLNSDAVVANDWLDRLRAAAYVSARVASVTPFSNNATICSYPRFCEGNTLPPGYDTARLDRLFARANAGAVIDIPTGIGFCMYIRRDSLNAIGLFDVESFGKGYGEENDFCRRADALGWRNLHALDTFVMHAGGVSFGASKNAREQVAMETLRRMYPDYEPIVHRFVQDDPARSYRALVDVARMAEETRPRVLMVLHRLGGGTTRHVTELGLHLRSSAISLALTPHENGTVQLQWVDRAESFELRFRWPEAIDALLDILRAIGVSHVHYHHLLGHGPEVATLAARLGVAYDFTAHDYMAVCPQISLTTADYAYCGELGIDQCRGCLAERPAPDHSDIVVWRARYGDFLNRARFVLTPSRDAARRLARYLPAARIRVAPHTDIALPGSLPQPQPHCLASHAHLRIVILGALSQIKGADVLEAVALEAARTDAPIELHLVGFAYRPLRTQPHASLTVHGAYTEEDLPALLTRLRPDVVWFPAQWPETYSYTLSAALLAAAPVVVPDAGAFVERIKGRAWSWIRPMQATPAEWVQFFTDIRAAHFVTGTAPVPAAAVNDANDDSSTAITVGQDAAQTLRRWTYEDDYLTHLAPAPAALLGAGNAADVALIGRQRLLDHLPTGPQVPIGAPPPPVSEPAPQPPAAPVGWARRLYRHEAAAALRGIVEPVRRGLRSQPPA